MNLLTAVTRPSFRPACTIVFESDTLYVLALGSLVELGNEVSKAGEAKGREKWRRTGSREDMMASTSTKNKATL